jgi:hypothetical protein
MWVLHPWSVLHCGKLIRHGLAGIETLPGLRAMQVERDDVTVASQKARARVQVMAMEQRDWVDEDM